MKKISVQKLTVLAMLSALAYILMLVTLLHIAFVPSLPFLNYDPKDIVIAIAGFMYGPASAFAVSAIVATMELLTTSDTGVIGWCMNLLATGTFCCMASYVYKRNQSKWGAAIGLGLGTVALTIVMVLWNLILTPIYMGMPREAIAAMILPGFIPFNLLKGALNSGAILLLHRPILAAFSAGRISTGSEPLNAKGSGKSSAAIGAALIACVALAIAILRGVA